MADILVIEDDDIMNDMLVKLLSDAGYQAVGVLDGTEALDALKKTDFHLIVTDIVMPDKDGIEVIHFAKRRNKSFPIIAVSGGGRIGPGDYLSLAQKFGADYTFEKPIDKDAFLGAVRECLS